MKFRGHLMGGVVAGAVVVGIAVQTGTVYLTAAPPGDMLRTILSGKEEALAAGGLFALTVIMSLFPDLDTASVPQRWFFRAAVILLAILLLLKQMDIFAIVTFILLLPLLHRHRGWTHSKLTPVVIAVFMVLVLAHIRTPYLLDHLSPELPVFLFKDYWIVMLAAVLGHYTHLVLDSR